MTSADFCQDRSQNGTTQIQVHVSYLVVKILEDKACKFAYFNFGYSKFIRKGCKLYHPVENCNFPNCKKSSAQKDTKKLKIKGHM